MTKIIIAAFLLVSLSGCTASFRAVPAYGTTYVQSPGVYVQPGYRYYQGDRYYDNGRRYDRRDERRWR